MQSSDSEGSDDEAHQLQQLLQSQQHQVSGGASSVRTHFLDMRSFRGRLLVGLCRCMLQAQGVPLNGWDTQTLWSQTATGESTSMQSDIKCTT